MNLESIYNINVCAKARYLIEKNQEFTSIMNRMIFKIRQKNKIEKLWKNPGTGSVKIGWREVII